MTQTDVILDMLLRREGAQIRDGTDRPELLTAHVALQVAGCFRLAARIKDLRDEGHNIVTETVRDNGKRYAGYYIVINRKQSTLF
tara:strand:+ start:1572 stop:1826 length:255 start_codon:yes stop_codon:yes gene_type:complete